MFAGTRESPITGRPLHHTSTLDGRCPCLLRLVPAHLHGFLAPAVPKLVIPMQLDVLLALVVDHIAREGKELGFVRGALLLSPQCPGCDLGRFRLEDFSQ